VQPAFPPITLGNRVFPMASSAAAARSEEATTTKGSYSLKSVILALLAVVVAYYGAGPAGKAACVVRIIYQGGQCPLDCWKDEAPLVENESSYAPEMSRERHAAS